MSIVEWEPLRDVLTVFGFIFGFIGYLSIRPNLEPIFYGCWGFGFAEGCMLVGGFALFGYFRRRAQEKKQEAKK